MGGAQKRAEPKGPDAGAHVPCGSLYMKCPKKADPRGEEGSQRPGSGPGRGVTTGGREGLVLKPDCAAQLCECTKRHGIACLKWACFMVYKFYPNKINKYAANLRGREGEAAGRDTLSNAPPVGRSGCAARSRVTPSQPLNLLVPQYPPLQTEVIPAPTSWQ